MKRTILNFLFGGPGSSRVGDIGLLVLRVGAGLLMAFGHGFSKVYADGRFGPPQRLIDNVANLNFPAPTAFAWMAALTEFVGGILLAVGLLTRPAALALAFNMSVAAFLVHRNDPLFAMGGPAKEAALTYLAPFVALVLLGPGRYAVDHVIARRRPAAAPVRHD